MLTHEEYILLCSDEVRQAIHQNRTRDVLAVAMDSSIPHARLVATQLKYLDRARTKLPSYAEAECILPPRAFEQASSERCAAHKPLCGERVLDLTCGLGVDARALAMRFREVVTLERNEVLAELTRENFRRLGINNVTVLTTDAESYVQHCTERFDWVYADPDRRSSEGKKLVRLEDCSPDVVKLMPHLQRLAPRLCLKNSPLFDVDEARRIFPDCAVEVVSLGGECKEVLISVGEGIAPRLTATAIDLGSYTTTDNGPITPPEHFTPARYRYLIQADVALQKARLVRRHLQGIGDVWSENGYGFATEEPQGVLGRSYAIERIEPYNPKALKRALKGHRAELLKHDFPFSIEELRRRLGVAAGDEFRLAFTKIEDSYWTIWLK